MEERLRVLRVLSREIDCLQELIGYLDWIEKSGYYASLLLRARIGPRHFDELECNVESLVMHLTDRGYRLTTSSPKLGQDGWPTDGRARRTAFKDYIYRLKKECDELIREATHGVGQDKQGQKSQGPWRKPRRRGRPRATDERERRKVLREYRTAQRKDRTLTLKDWCDSDSHKVAKLKKDLAWYRTRKRRQKEKKADFREPLT